MVEQELADQKDTLWNDHNAREKRRAVDFTREIADMNRHRRNQSMNLKENLREFEDHVREDFRQANLSVLTTLEGQLNMCQQHNDDWRYRWQAVDKELARLGQEQDREVMEQASRKAEVSRMVNEIEEGTLCMLRRTQYKKVLIVMTVKKFVINFKWRKLLSKLMRESIALTEQLIEFTHSDEEPGQETANYMQ